MSDNVIDNGRVRLTIFAAQVRSEAKKASLPDREAMAYEVALKAIDLAPVVSGAYQGGIDVVVDGDDVFVVDNDPIAFMKEFGTVDTPAHLILSEAAQELAKYNDKGAFRQAMGKR
ncbi:HK97 gp10 family phage protein [Nocardia sp. NPDC005746]|uniref:HK97 gp10 family phage protein n=1 Tax=Nocardia sp. NPDC005746 TaxID=3157062 RepID=UPI0033FDB465